MWERGKNKGKEGEGLLIILINTNSINILKNYGLH